MGKMIVLVISAFLLGTFGLVHQRVVAGMWFDWSQFWHHEPLIAICLVASVSLIVGGLLCRR